jgi:hypothetical protein
MWRAESSTAQNSLICIRFFSFKAPNTYIFRVLGSCAHPEARHEAAIRLVEVAQ